MSAIMLLFNIVKLFYDLFLDLPAGSTLFEWFYISSPRDYNSKTPVIFQRFFLEDMTFIFSSLVCFYSAMTYKFVIKQSTRSTHIKVLSTLLPILKTIAMLVIIYFAFFKADEFLNLLFLLLLTFLVIWILYDKSAFYNYTSHKSTYMWYIKWILFFFILFTHTMKSVHYEITEQKTASFNLDYFLSTLNRENPMSLEYVFFIAASYLYLKNVLRGA